jgi:hypothetical protein
MASADEIPSLQRLRYGGWVPADPAYVSRVRIERLGGPQRLAYLPAEDRPIAFGVHSQVAEHYGVSPDQFPPHATTLDYVVAAAGG